MPTGGCIAAECEAAEREAAEREAAGRGAAEDHTARHQAPSTKHQAGTKCKAPKH